jgi:NTP pyrophosphatase (non-canonical NTP hydrolase)
MRTLGDMQNEVDRLIKEEWQSDYWAPLSSLARLTEEVGELAREINQSYGEKPKKSSEGRGSIAGEIGDILFIVATLANSIEVDLDSAFEAVMAKYRRRDAQRWSQSSQPQDEAAGS